MIKLLPFRFLPIFTCLLIAISTLSAQQVVFNEDFSQTQSSTYTTSGPIGSSIWTVARSGQDLGARISGGMLTLTNDATTGANSGGWLMASTSTSNYSPVYKSTLSQNPGVVSWVFNMRQSRANPSSFKTSKFGVAFILAGTPTTNTTGNGYAIVLGQNLTIDPIKLVTYNNGLSSLSAAPDAPAIITSNTTGFKDFGAEYTSIRVEYNPADNKWSLFVRKDNSTSFNDPNTGTLTFQGTTVDATYVTQNLTTMGGYWNANKAKLQTALFDNVSVRVETPELISLNPDSKIAGSAQFDIYASGQGFLPTSKAYWNGQIRTTAYISDTQLKITIPATDVIVSGSATITVKNGEVISNGLPFTIEPSGNPALTISATSLNSLTTVTGTASAVTNTYTIRGDNLTGAATVIAPPNFEISLDGTTWATSLTLPNTGGGLTTQPTTLRARIKASALAGIYTGNISHTAAGAVTKLVAISGKVLALEPTLAASNITFTNLTSTGFKLNWNNGNGAQRLVLVRSLTAVNASPSDGTSYNANAAFPTGSQIGTDNFVVYKGTGNSVQISSLTPSTVYHVSVIEFNGLAGVENYRGSGAINNTTTLNSPVGLQVKLANTSYKINFDDTVDGVNLDTFQGLGVYKVVESGQLDSNAWAFSGFTGGNIGFAGNSLEDSSYENGPSDGSEDETGIYAFNVSDTADNYTLGIQPGGTDFNPGSITLKIQNQTGVPMTSVNIGYKVYVNNDQDASSKITFSYGSSATGTYTTQPIVDVVSPASADLAPGWKAYYRVVTIPNLNIASNAYYYIRWSGSLISGTGAQDEFAIDDIEVIANPSTNVVAFDGVSEDFILQGNAALSNDLVVQNRLLFNGGKLAIKDQTLTVAGSVTNTSLGGITGGATSSLFVSGTKNPSLSFDQTTIGTTNAFQNFSVVGANANTVTIANPVVLNQILKVDELNTLNLGTVALTGALTSIVNNGAILTQNTTTAPFPANKIWNGTGILNLNATSTAQTLVAGTYSNLKLSSTIGTTAIADSAINGTLDLPAANASATKGSLDMGANTLLMGPDAINIGIGEVTGIIKRNSFVANKLYTFGHPNSSIIFPAMGTLPTTMSAKLTLGTAPAWRPTAIKRYYDIIQSGGSGTKAIIRQHYLDSELNAANTESKLVFWGRKVVANQTFEQGKSNSNTVENYVEIGNANVAQYFVSTFGQVFISLDNTADTEIVTWNGSVSDSWTTIENWTPNVKPSSLSKVFIPAISSPNFNPTLNPTEEIGSLNIAAGAIVNSTDTAQLIINMGTGAWQNYGTFNPGAGNSNVTFTNAEATMAGATTFNNITITNGASLRALEGNSMSIAGTFSNNGVMSVALLPNIIEFTGVNQTIPLSGGSGQNGYYTLKISGTGATIAASNLNIRGNIIVNNPVSFAGKTVNFTGVVDQIIGGTAISAFDQLVINKQSNKVMLAQDIEVGSTLTLTKGNVVIGTNNLTLGANPVAGSFGVNNMIVADGTGQVRRPFITTGEYLFPIGEMTGATSYSPITVNVTSGIFSDAYVGVNVKDAVHPNNNSLENISMYWNVKQSGILNALATITAKYESLDINGSQVSIAAAQLNGPFNVITNPWIKFDTLSNNTLIATNAILTSGQISAFTGLKADTFSIEVEGYGDFCIGSSHSLNAVISGGDAPFTYSWTPTLENAPVVEIPTSIVGITNYTLTVRDANGFTATDNNIPVEILPESFGGTIANNVQQICAGTSPADLVLNGSVGNVLYWQKSTVADFSTFQNLSVFTTTINASEIGPLNETTYFRAILQNGDCDEQFSSIATVTIKSTTWNGMSWTNGNPDSVTTAIFEANYTATASINACNVIVKNGAIVTIPTGFTLTANGAVKVESGSLTFENNANLIQIAEVQNSGNVVVKRNSSALKRLDYTLWSSPVTNQPLFSFSPQTTANRFYFYNSADNVYNVIPSSPTTVFDRAKGYLIRMPNNHPATVPTIWNGSFTGVPHNGTITVPLQNFGAEKRFTLVGNPYPSPIDARLFVQNVSNDANITGTLYFWRKTNDATQPSYYTWTTLGLVAPITTDQTVVANNNDVIQTGQGFFVEAKENATSFVFNNAMRKDDHANQFFKATTEATEYNRVWLNATNAEGWFSQTLIGYFTDGSDDLDSSDGKYINDGDIAFSSLISNVPYAIQGKSLPFNPSDVVPMYLKVKNAGNYTIAIDHVDGLFLGTQEIFLRDNLLEISHNLKLSPYTFATQAGSFDSRFEVVYQNASLSVDNPIFTSNSVVLYKKANEVVINAGNTILEHVEVFDIRGRLLANAKKINATEVSINVGEVNQVLIVKITSKDGITVSKKTVN